MKPASRRLALARMVTFAPLLLSTSSTAPQPPQDFCPAPRGALPPPPPPAAPAELGPEELEAMKKRARRAARRRREAGYVAATVANEQAWVPDLASYDRIVVALSGGKDSIACLLHLLELGVPRSKIELLHYEVDGREGSTLMDWPCTPDYCRAIARAFGLPIFFAWKVGGFEGEMLKENARTAATRFETPDRGVIQIGGKRGKLGTRLKYPQVAASLSARWCSAYLKIDVGEKVITNQRRFVGTRTLIVTGERAEESAGRAKYATFEIDRADNRDGRQPRHVDRWLAVHGWNEAQVWAIIERHRVNVHPCYRLGWGRCSCAPCIFGNANQWASLRAVNEAQFNVHAANEVRFGRTINRKLSVVQLADKGTPYERDPFDVRVALDPIFDEPVILAPGTWTLPRGAFGDTCGPT